MNMQIRGNFGAMDTASGDMGTFLGKIDNLREEARAEFNKIIANLGDGIGPEQVSAVRAKFEDYLQQHLDSMKSSQAGLDRATDTMRAGAAKMADRLANR